MVEPSQNRGLFRSYLISSFSGDLVLTIFYIYLPLFSYELGASTFEVGLVGGSSYLVYSVMPVIVGRLSDRTKSKPMLLSIAFGLITVCSLLYAIAPNAETLAVVRLFEGLGWAVIWPIVEAGISETSNKSFESQRLLGVYNYVWSGAAAVGPLLGAVLVFVFTIRDTFFITCGLLAVALVVNLRHVRTPSSAVAMREERGLKSEEESSRKVVNERKGPGGFQGAIFDLAKRHAVILMATAVVLLADATLLTFFPPYAESKGISVLMIGAVTFSFGASRFATYYAISKPRIRRMIISPKKRIRNILVALAIASVSGVFLSVGSLGLFPYFLSFVLLGFGFAIITTIAQIVLIAEAPLFEMGMGAGLLESTIGAGSFLGPVLGGIISGGSIVVTFFVPVTIFLILLPAIGFFVRTTK